MTNLGFFNSVDGGYSWVKAGRGIQFCITNDEFCITNYEFCITNDEFCIKIRLKGGLKSQGFVIR